MSFSLPPRSCWGQSSLWLPWGTATRPPPGRRRRACWRRAKCRRPRRSARCRSARCRLEGRRRAVGGFSWSALAWRQPRTSRSGRQAANQVRKMSYPACRIHLFCWGKIKKTDDKNDVFWQKQSKIIIQVFSHIFSPIVTSFPTAKLTDFGNKMGNLSFLLCISHHHYWEQQLVLELLGVDELRDPVQSVQGLQPQLGVELAVAGNEPGGRGGGRGGRGGSGR